MQSKWYLFTLLLAHVVCSTHAYDLQTILAKIIKYKQYEKYFFSRHQQLTAIINPTPQEIQSRHACELGWTWAKIFIRECFSSDP